MTDDGLITSNITVPMEDYDLAFVAEDSEPKNHILIVLTKFNGDMKTPRLLKLKYDWAAKHWHRSESNELMELKSVGRPQNCFILPNRKVMLVLSKVIHIYNEDLTLDVELKIDSINDRVNYFSCARSTFKVEKKSSGSFHFWGSFVVTYTDFKTHEDNYLSEYKSIKANWPKFGSWIVKLRLDLKR